MCRSAPLIELESLRDVPLHLKDEVTIPGSGGEYIYPQPFEDHDSFRTVLV